MSDYGIKVAKPGFDAKTAGLNNLLFHSSYPLLKIKQKGSGSITYTNDAAPTDILVAIHNLGYKPLFRFMIQFYDIDSATKQNSYRQAPFIDSLVGGSVNFSARPYADDIGLRLRVGSFDGNGGVKTLQFFYKIYYDPDLDI